MFFLKYELMSRVVCGYKKLLLVLFKNFISMEELLAYNKMQ